MNLEQALKRVIEALESVGVDYMIVGSFSCTYYGFIRLTADADVVVAVRPGQIQQIREQLSPELIVDPQMSFETATMTFRHIITSPDEENRIELFLVGEDEHDQSRFERRKRVRFLEKDVYLPTVEDVVVTKARWLGLLNRIKDRLDLVGILTLRNETIDWPYVYSWADKHGTRQLLDELRSRIPKI